MDEKIDNLKEMEYYSNFNTVGEYIIKWKKAKPKNNDLIILNNCLVHMGFYVNDLIANQKMYDKSLSEYRSDKIRAVNRARKAEDNLKTLQEKYKKLKLEKELGV